jgi:hypothetical protein
MPGQETHFQVTFANYRANQVTAEVGLSVYDDGGTLVADLAPQMIPIGRRKVSCDGDARIVV